MIICYNFTIKHFLFVYLSFINIYIKMIDSKIKFFSPIHRNYKLDLGIIFIVCFFTYVYMSNMIQESAKLIWGTSMVICYIISHKIYDFYSILEKKKSTVSNFKLWLNFTETKQYKFLLKLIYLYFLTIVLCIVGSIYYFGTGDGMIRKTMGIIVACSFLLHAAATFINFKKIQK